MRERRKSGSARLAATETRSKEAHIASVAHQSAGTTLARALLTHMLDRDKIVAVLRRRFPGSASGQVAAAANAIVGLDEEWEEIASPGVNGDAVQRAPCREGCYLARAAEDGMDVKVFRRKIFE